MAAITSSRIKLEKLLFAGPTDGTDPKVISMGCYIKTLHMPELQLSSFDHLKELDLLLAVRPTKTCE